MSEPVLKAILRLFALVAKEDQVTESERQKVEEFLGDHLGLKSIPSYLGMFDSYADQIGINFSPGQQRDYISSVAKEINVEIAQKQRTVIILELMNIILADGTMSEREEFLVKEISQALLTTPADLNSITHYVLREELELIDDENILLIHSKEKTNGKSKFLFRKDMDGFISILHQPSTNIYFFKYYGQADVYLNGVPQKPGNINVLAAGSTIRWGNADPVYYGNILACFTKPTENKKISFEAKNISYKFRSGKLGLRSVSIVEESGNLIALMGASGAGKSTLLHVLNGTETPSSGEVLINGINIHQFPNKVQGVIGFVPQEDLLVEDLSVYQNLYFAAKLCFNNLNEKEIDGLVMKTLNDLGLTETKDLKVGSPLRKTISGGQRKRLNIGLELLREPSILFVDEPTSGLSSRDSENIIDLLKELSLKGKLVFAVIHQPSSAIFKMFDRLVILDSGGYQIYYGNPVDAVAYFKRGINMVNSEQGECQECGNVNPEQIFNIIETKVINEFGNFTNERKFSSEQWNAKFVETKQNFIVQPVAEEPDSTLRIPGWFKQGHLFAMRDILSKLSNRQYMVINLLEAPLLAFILAFITRYYNADDSFFSDYVFSKNLNLPAYLFMSIIVALFMGLTVSAEEIIRDRKILKRESFLNLNRSSYLVSKISILFTLSAIQTSVYVLVGNSILEIKDMFFIHWGLLFTTSCFANLLGLNISSAFNSAVTIYILIPILLIPQLILSGVVVKFDKLNPAIGNTAAVPIVGDLMASRWAFEAAMVSQFKDNKYEKDFYLWDKIMANSDYNKIYLIPELETKLEFAYQNISSPEKEKNIKVSGALNLLKNEIEKTLEKVGRKHFTSLDYLTTEKFDSVTYVKTKKFLEALKNYYVTRFNMAEGKKEEKINQHNKSLESKKQFENFKVSYQNEAIAELVKNISEPRRIIERNGEFVQKIYPIYKDPDSDDTFGLDAQFYMPAKNFLNQNIDTFWFNIGVIWSMSFFLSVMLYFDILRLIIEFLDNLSNRTPKRM